MCPEQRKSCMYVCMYSSPVVLRTSPPFSKTVLVAAPVPSLRNANDFFVACITFDIGSAWLGIDLPEVSLSGASPPLTKVCLRNACLMGFDDDRGELALEATSASPGEMAGSSLASLRRSTSTTPPASSPPPPLAPDFFPPFAPPPLFPFFARPPGLPTPDCFIISFSFSPTNSWASGD